MLSYNIFVKAEKLRQALENPGLLPALPDYRYESEKDLYRNAKTGECFSVEHGKITLPGGITIDTIFVGKKLEEIK